MSSRPTKVRAIAAWAIVLACAAAPHAAGGAHASSSSTSASHGGPLSDSLLARIGTRRDVSLAGFRRAWSSVAPPQRPDSLTPDAARKFLDLLIDKEVLAEAAMRETWTWTPRESAGVSGLEDRLTLGAVLDSALRATALHHAARGDTIRDLELLGTITRDSTVAHMSPAFDTTLARRLAADWAAIPRPSPDSSLISQLKVLGAMPVVAKDDLGRVLARSNDGDIYVHELLESWRRLDPTQRPRVSTPAQIEDLARNALFERMLRRQAKQRNLAQRHDIVAQVERQREYVCVSHLVAREVYATLIKPDGTLNADSVTLQRFYYAHPGAYDLPMRVRMILLDLPDRAAAEHMAAQLRDAAFAESLIARGQRSKVNYITEVAREGDSLMFERTLAAPPGSVLGPDSTSDGWRVVRVREVVAARSRTFREAEPLVEHAWYNEEGERRMVELVARLRKQTTVRTNPHALTRLIAEGPSPGAHGGAQPPSTAR